MQFSQVLVAATSYVALVGCTAIPASYSVHEKRQSPLRQWTKRGRVQTDAVLPIRIGLTQTNLEKGHEFLMEVSDPASPRYGQHWTDIEVLEIFKPAAESVDVVFEWLIASGISKDGIIQSENREWLVFDATGQESENLLLTEFYEYENSETGKIAVACDEYSLPTHLQPHIDYITPGIRLISMSKQVARRGFGMQPGRIPSLPPPVHILPPISAPKQDPSIQSTPSPLATCNQQITPECIKALYQVPIGTKSNSTNRMGIFEAGDTYNQEDFDLFFKNIYPAIPKKTAPKKQLVNGAVAPVAQSEAGLESDLDFQVAYPLLWPQGTVLYQLSDEDSFNSFLDAIDGSYCKYEAFGQKGDDPNFDPKYPSESYAGRTMCGRFKPTNVISVSYGGSEWDIPAYYQRRQCNEFMKLGLQGVSVFFSSGDSGVGGSRGCINGNVFNPVWPATCPYITAVGATKIRPGKKVTDEEVAASEDETSIFGAFASGGGFSNVYSAPEYQKNALKTYFSSHNPTYDPYSAFGTSYDPGEVAANGGLYNRLGRGIPDVSANGDNVTVFYQGQKALAAGTSASAPMFAAILNRINEERLAVGKSTVGFINPVLYANPGILNDIRKGQNPGCGTDGFAAVKGWDPVTGLGTPNFPKMLKLWMKLP